MHAKFWLQVLEDPHEEASWMNNIEMYLKKQHAVAQLVEALRYKPEGRGIDSRLCHCNFSLT
jgi:hypothetical protein